MNANGVKTSARNTRAAVLPTLNGLLDMTSPALAAANTDRLKPGLDDAHRRIPTGIATTI
jgi:hypothetical protein